MSLNKVMLIGNVGRDPEVRYLEGGANGNAKVASFSVATTERYRDRNGETRENTDWHNVVAWRGNADVVEKYVKKGTQLYIEGRLKTREWTDQTGNKRYTTEVLVDNLQLLGRKSDNPASAQNGGYGAPAQGGYQTQGAYQAPAQGGYQAPAQPARPTAQPAQPGAPAINLADMENDEDLPF